MVYEPLSGLIVLFGGSNYESWPNTRYYNDTWVFDLAAVDWRQVAPIESPSARHDHGMVYDSASNQIVLFGGHTEAGSSDETWAYDLAGNAWTHLRPAASPPASDVANQMAYNAASGKLVLLLPRSYPAETWIYDPASVAWSKAMPASRPTYWRNYGALVDNPIDGRVVLFGGDLGYHGDIFTAPPFFYHHNDTWLYDVGRDEWVQVHPAQDPGDRAGHAMVYHSPTGKIDLFGGKLGFCPYLNDEMWSYDLAANSWSAVGHGTVPTPPFGLHGTGADQTVELTWMAPRDAGTSPIISYRIYWSAIDRDPLASVYDWSIIEVGNDTHFVQSGLLNGLRYAHSVSAVNREGEGPLSCYAVATPTAPPGAPRNLTAQAGDGEVLLQWDPPEDAGHFFHLDYDIYRGLSPENLTLLAEISNTTYDDTNLTNGVTYYYYVVTTFSALFAGDTSPPSRVVSAIPGREPEFNILWLGAAGIPTAVAVVVLLRWHRGHRGDER